MRINKKIALTILCAAGFSAQADVVNGGFESWQGSRAAGWDTIDSGIVVTQQSNIVKVGSSSAQVTVNTASQASTDLLQTVDVIAGQTYAFSTWVYHTEGAVKARLIVDGYQGYSDEHSVNQWQQIQYAYTATSSKKITVGLRFYDVTGFDGSEIVYVDDFQPSATPPPTDNNQCTEDNATLSLTTDNYGSETSWSLTGSAGEVASATGLSNNTLYTKSYCLLPGEYTFTINDAYGDGICCTYGQGSYQITVANNVVVSGASFGRSESKTFTIAATSPGNGGGTPPTDLETYYTPVTGLTGFDLKTGLYNIIAGHNAQGYGAIWGFYELHALDKYYENDGSILDIYSEKPQGTDSYNYIKVSNQCGSYSGEGGCYNREHSFPKSWFGGQVEPMNSDIHHIFATDGFVNSKRSSFPYGEVGAATFTSSNGSQLGQAVSTLGFSGTVFEPIDEFKGDLARAYFYMATRYENVIAGWQSNSSYGDAILNGSSDKVFENWHITMLLRWHQQDPVSQKEIDRNNAAFEHQGNRNPFIDHPEFATMIWQ
ncbi:hypothetical protein PULV_a2555 [Pseudoalteromonas ulvae UL12]|uniref:endonuclease n=1 Tax=Pseudoalteromonas ulvae TaxID=107327 RepID=UPI0019E66A99|nr:endonuclease [Pseudoalteromonas ulvae]MBE0364263.1 hypothetical protein [Pseudoalteromonas ulvae UL12]